MLRLTKAPSFKKGNGVAAAASAGSRTPSGIPFSNVAARMGFKRGGEPGKPQFDFQAPIHDAKEPDRVRELLMKRTASQVYNQMGLSVKAHEVSRAALIWLNQLKETMSGDEQEVATRLARRLGDLVEELYHVREDKIQTAKDLEIALTAEKQKMRNAKKKKAVLQNPDEVQGMARPERANTYWPEEDHPEQIVPSIALDPAQVLQGVADEIKAKEKTSKKAKNKAVKSNEENETS